MDCLHANARHVSRRFARVTWHRRAGKHLGSGFAHRCRRNPWYRLFASRADAFTLSHSRSPLDRVTEIDERKMPETHSNLQIALSRALMTLSIGIVNLYAPY